MSGLSLRALGEALDEQVPHAALAKYEKGLMGPSSTVLIALGRALGVDNDYFFRSTAVSLSGIEFRKRTKCFCHVRQLVVDLLTRDELQFTLHLYAHMWLAAL